MASPVTIRIVGDLDPAQPLDADLTALAANITAAGHALVDDASAAAQRTTLGLVAGGAGDIWVEKAGDTLTGDLTMQSAGAATNLDTYSLTATTASLLTFRKSNDATVGVQGAVTHDPETLGNIIFYGSDGTAFREAARITAQTDTTPGPSDMPGRLSIRTTPDGATSATEKIYISRSGVIINEQGLAHEFRVESDTLTHAFYLDPNTGEPRLAFLAGTGARLVQADADGDLAASNTLTENVRIDNASHAVLELDAGGGGAALVTLLSNGVKDWEFGGAGAGDFYLYNFGLGRYELSIDDATGEWRVADLAGTGQRVVEADADGDLSATRALGLDFVAAADFTTSSAVNVNAVFTSAYRNYRVIVVLTAATALAFLDMRMRAGGADTATSNYYRAAVQRDSVNATVAAPAQSGETYWRLLSLTNGTMHGTLTMDLSSPQTASTHTRATYAEVTANATGYEMVHGGLAVNLGTQFDGFSLLPASGTVSGRYYVYGYRES